MRENLFLRTDTLPEEIPLLFSNSSLYENFNRERIEKDNNTILNSFHTVPLYFYIPKNNLENRKMALLHPIAQLQIFQYILRYDQLIVSYSKNSKYSVRSPIIRNQPVFIPSQAIKDELIRIEQEFSFTQGVSITSDETEAFFYNYFSYRNHKKITNLYKSNKFRRDLYKYNFFKKLDIQNFFGSIYTHSIAWAVFGDKSIAKKYKGRSFDEIFPNATDKVCQLINFNETNGIVVGPEFSRVISELLLTRIDVNLYQALEKENIQLGKDYKIYRFLDDFFIFFNDKKIIEMIEENLFINLESYNLKLNTSKSELQSKPFFVSDPAIIKLISLLDLFLINTQTNLSFSIYNKKTKSLWLKLQQNIELILLEYPNSTSKLLNYFLKFVRSILKLEIHQFNLAHILETITNIYSLNINYHSTHNLIATYAVLSQKIVKLSAEEKYDLKDKVEYLEERFFQHLFISLRDNSDKLPQMYDLFIYLKTLPKKISSDYLCEVLDNYNDYFITCSIAYYILDNSLTRINPIYITVLKKLKTKFEKFDENYKSKGADSKFLESDFFYFLNDFSFYPAFDINLRSSLKKTLLKNSNYSITQNSSKEVIETITSEPYYKWDKTPEDFIKEIAKKSSNLLNRSIKYN